MSKAENLIEEKTKTIISKLHQEQNRKFPTMAIFLLYTRNLKILIKTFLQVILC